jgi:hypothetical protein
MVNDLHTAVARVGAIIVIIVRAAIPVSIAISIMIAWTNAHAYAARTRADINVLRARWKR